MLCDDCTHKTGTGVRDGIDFVICKDAKDNHIRQVPCRAVDRKGCRRFNKIQVPDVIRPDGRRACNRINFRSSGRY